MSMIRCTMAGCREHVREGLRRSGAGVDGQPLADGRTCWRCRARQATAESRKKARRAAAEQLEKDLVVRARLQRQQRELDRWRGRLTPKKRRRR